LRDFGVNGHRVVGKTGVWVGGEPGAKPAPGQNPAGRKIAAMGVRVSAGVAMHGFALNVTTDLSYFSHIVPCGMPDLPVTSIAGETGERIATSDVAASAASHLGALLQRDLSWVDSKAIAA
jgi:lipoyl(octanoyl) transferase